MYAHVCGCMLGTGVHWEMGSRGGGGEGELAVSLLVLELAAE